MDTSGAFIGNLFPKYPGPLQKPVPESISRNRQQKRIERLRKKRQDKARDKARVARRSRHRQSTSQTSTPKVQASEPSTNCSASCGKTTPAAATPDAVPSDTRVTVRTTPTRKLANPLEEVLNKKGTKLVGEQPQHRQVRDAAKIDAKSKINEATDNKAKLRSYTTLLKLKLHID
ncbi:hypothetical protein PtrSN002B_006279 [Pyrenophora tritici-repentis]|uniref:Uncharacterized protein n=2 Tax=Pyrenophora tritici-repentis TaxID=45151 RepID=A0A2W1EVB7_9PLEO|nr:uncharacterized protein PTRG_02272 [Pyrenophora tritici-repentis Pt-1C-BFP]KAA8627004.1 hypothetical protein PtrV1_02684 [Pyrenophora tritici-repentis]EDU41710.1 hypothetical protein PTRG_02272 [Pyrenophora tritici-repentis Pt-1C-BFP]KAF7455445.1 hypothetical protein A1F99_027030 [Pyrenophora tritici-repentis]KAF7578630.1 hypothetical protein PtrM4_028700 [Pyrenophora tritici-repentis]KAI0576262.1 hypothetical protein Alg215_07555 [Pyrenophora tritici-repentis]